MTSVVHKVAVQVAVGVSGIGLLSKLSSELLGAHMSANKLKAALSNLGWGSKAALGGIAATTAGLAMFASLKAPLSEAERWQQAVTKFSLLGLGDRANDEAVKFAQSMRIIGSSYTDNMNYLREAQGVFRESGLRTPAEQLAAAKMVAPTMAKLSMIDSTLDPEARGRYHTQELAMLRFAEMSGGLQSSERMQAILENGYKAITSSGGNVNWDSLRQFRVHARASGFNLSDEALFAKFEPLIGELKGSAGVALSTAYSRLNGINTIMPRSAIDLYGKMGLWDMSKVHSKGGFGRLQFDGNPLKDSALFGSDPVEFYNKYVKPFYDQHDTSATDRYRQNSILFGGTGGNLFNLIEKQSAVIERSVQAQAKVLGINQSYDKASQTIAGMKADAKTNFENAGILIGVQVIPLLTTALQTMLPMLRSAVTWMTKNPEKLGLIVKGFVGLASVLTVLGTVSAVIGVAKILSLVTMFGRLGGVFSFVARAAGFLWPLLVSAGEAIGGVVAVIAAIIGLPVEAVVGGIIAIGAAIVGLVLAIRHWSTVKKVIAQGAAAVTHFFGWLGGKVIEGMAAAQTAFGGLLNFMIQWFRDLPGKIAHGAGDLLHWAEGLVGGNHTNLPAPPQTHAVPHVTVNVKNTSDIKTHIDKHLGVGKPQTGPTAHNPMHTWTPPGAVPTG